jgi:hypothetical protein
MNYLEDEDINRIKDTELHSVEALKQRLRQAQETPDFNNDLFTQMNRSFFAVSEDP